MFNNLNTELSDLISASTAAALAIRLLFSCFLSEIFWRKPLTFFCSCSIVSSVDSAAAYVRSRRRLQTTTAKAKPILRGPEMEYDMKFQGYSIQIIVTSVLEIFLLAAGLVTNATYAFVKITSPTKGQHVPVGNILISRVSSSNSTNHCIVSVIINGIRPYQQVTSTGMNGPMDYSKWTFVATPEYTTIKEGMNKITAEYSPPRS